LGYCIRSFISDLCLWTVPAVQGRGSLERLEIVGPGDPSGRGLGFSYLRVATKPPNAGALVEKKAAAARGGGAVTGTDADLRRLSMEAAREV
jgi:transcription initiation factor TFIID subunit 1